jgi:ribulose-phosphate 3-epimerase
MGKILISPSLLAADITRLGEAVQTIETSADMLHIDVMDGHFVPNISFGIPVVKGMRAATKLPLDVHLMITNPSQYIKAFAEAGSDIITIHAEIEEDVGACLEAIHACGKRCGLALNPDTPPEKAAPFIDRVDMILQMTVFPGFGGQSMIESAIEHLPVLREMIGPDKDLQVDGGIYPENCALPIRAGANVIVSGTGVFGRENPALAIEQMKKEAVF